MSILFPESGEEKWKSTRNGIGLGKLVVKLEIKLMSWRSGMPIILASSLATVLEGGGVFHGRITISESLLLNS